MDDSEEFKGRETITCGIGERFMNVSFSESGGLECSFCGELATKVTEEYVDIYITYEGGGGSDATLLFLCRSHYNQHLKNVEKAVSKGETTVIYEHNVF